MLVVYALYLPSATDPVILSVFVFMVPLFFCGTVLFCCNEDRCNCLRIDAAFREFCHTPGVMNMCNLNAYKEAKAE